MNKTIRTAVITVGSVAITIVSLFVLMPLCKLLGKAGEKGERQVEAIMSGMMHWVEVDHRIQNPDLFKYWPVQK